MFAPIRAGLLAALFAVACVVSAMPPAAAQTPTPAQTADKPFSRADLDDAAVRLEGQIKKLAHEVAFSTLTVQFIKAADAPAEGTDSQ